MPTPSKKRSAPQDAIVVLGGSFCPPHAGHLFALEAGKIKAERDGLRVVAGYFAVAPQTHVQGKLRTRGEDRGLAFEATDRIRMCNAAAATTCWLRPTHSTFGSAQTCATAMVLQHHTKTTRIVTVRGRDVDLLQINGGGETLSSTLIRRELLTDGLRAPGRLVERRVLLQPVAQLLLAHHLARHHDADKEEAMVEAPMAAAPPLTLDTAEAPDDVQRVHLSAGEAVLAVNAPAVIFLDINDDAVDDADTPPSPKRLNSRGESSLARALCEDEVDDLNDFVGCEDDASVGGAPAAGPPRAMMPAPTGGDVHVFRGEWDESGMSFYQAYSAEIAEWAVREQRFGGPHFNASRMTWIKPSFAWVLYRSGYGRKHNQQRILKVKLPHALVAELLSACACKHGGGGSKGRVQWDPARDLMSSESKGREPRRMLRERAIQIGLSRDLSERYVAGALSITDVSALAQQVGVAHGAKDERQVKVAIEQLLPQLPQERPYMPLCADEVLMRLGMM